MAKNTFREQIFKHEVAMTENSNEKQSVKREADVRRNTDNNPFSKVKAESTGNAGFIHPFNLESETELCILVGDNFAGIKIELMSGLAEVYGTEMEQNKTYSFSSNSTIAVFSWHGCEINVYGIFESASVVTNPAAMILKVVFHASIEERRLQAIAGNKSGPVTLIVGPNDVDKIKLCQLLLNYAVHMGRRPLFIDLNVGESSITIPTAIGVLTVEKPTDIVTGFDKQSVEVYPFGYRRPWENIILYLLLLNRLSHTLQPETKLKNQNVRTSGVIINTWDASMSEIRHHGLDAYTLVAKIFEIDILCVLQDEKMYLQLKSVMPSSVEIVFIPKLDHFINRNEYIKRVSREARFNEYFKPNSKNFRYEVKYSDIEVFKVSTAALKEDRQFLVDVTENDACLKSISLNEKLVGQILAISSAETVEEDIMFMPVIGFICVTHVNMLKNTITVLSPEPEPLPKKILLLGNTRFTSHSRD